MKIDAQNLKPGELTDELRDYKLLQTERENNARHEQILAKIDEIKQYIFNDQQNQIRQLELRVSKLEEEKKRERKQIRIKTKEKQQIKITTIGSIITQSISILTSIITVTILLYFNLK